MVATHSLLTAVSVKSSTTLEGKENKLFFSFCILRDFMKTNQQEKKKKKNVVHFSSVFKHVKTSYIMQ
jgi:hypothetical protein